MAWSGKQWNAFWSSLGNQFGNWKNYTPGGFIEPLAKSGWLSGSDALLPGSTALNNIFDLKGTQAAQNQFEAQSALNRQAQAFNASEAEKQRAWESSMASTAYQRQVADMQAAGLNPYAMMAGGYSSGSAVPSGSSAQVSSGSADMANNKLAAAAGAFAIFLRMFLTKK